MLPYFVAERIDDCGLSCVWYCRKDRPVVQLTAGLYSLGLVVIDLVG